MPKMTKNTSDFALTFFGTVIAIMILAGCGAFWGIITLLLLAMFLVYMKKMER